MFVIELSYKADLSAIDACMKPHVAFLKKHYAAGADRRYLGDISDGLGLR